MDFVQIHPESVERLLFLVPLIPFVGAAINGLFGRWLGRDNVGFIASAAVAIPFAISVGVMFALLGGSEQFRVLEQIYPWIHVGSFAVDVRLVADHLTAIMLLVITGVGFLIHVYSIGYMAHDEGYWRYFAYLNLFVGMMLVLVLGDSLPLLFVGWEGVGLCSYLLIGFWYDDVQKANAGMKAFIVNRIGDFGFLIGMFTLFAVFGTLNITSLRGLAQAVNVHATIPAGMLFGGWTVRQALTLAMITLFVGATGKSAQIPLFVWLPDAMAGPTPVSALIHAATMVTAGVYMLSRLSFLLVLAPAAMILIAVIGALTAIVGAFMALFQNGIKKVLAYSTVSQLGYMFLGVGVGAFSAGVYHLFTHAFFKALLFLGAGSVMHAMGNEEDIRKMGGLAKKMPHTRWTFWVATVAITGVFVFSGFWSKDAILHEAVSARFELGDFWTGALPWLLWGIGALAALFTSVYMWRLYVLTFKGEPRDAHLHAHAHESPPSMTVPLWFLAAGAIGASYWGISELFEGPSFKTWLDPVTAEIPRAAAETGPHLAVLRRGHRHRLARLRDRVRHLGTPGRRGRRGGPARARADLRRLLREAVVGRGLRGHLRPAAPRALAHPVVVLRRAPHRSLLRRGGRQALPLGRPHVEAAAER